MKENSTKNRKWVIKCAVIFFVVLLLLTFFSNTIMNYSLPQVATQSLQSGSIASKVRGSGTVAAANPTNITINTERKVKLVAVKEGDTVSEGTLLLMFEDGEDSEVTTAQKTLSDAQKSYRQYIVTNEISDDMVAKIENGESGDYSSYQEQLANATAAVNAAQQSVDSYNASAKTIQARIDTLQNAASDTSAEQTVVNTATAESKEAENAVTIAQNNAESLEQQYNLYLEADMDVSDIAAQLAAAKATLSAAQNRQTQCQNTLEKAQESLTAKQENKENQAELTALQAQLTEVNTALSTANDTLTAAQTAHQKILDTMNAETELANLYQNVTEAQAALDKANESGSSNKITSGVSGTVTSVNVVKGGTAAAGETLMTIADETSGYTATITVTTEQSRRIKVGDSADIDQSWYYSDVTAVVTAIRNNSENPGQSKLVDIKITGDVPEGTSLDFAIGDKSSSYDYIVPNGAVREDKNGKFVLIIRQKSSPLGNRYFAKRVNVQVLASDDVHSAVSGDFSGGEFVITTSTKSINPGDQVRLTES